MNCRKKPKARLVALMDRLSRDRYLSGDEVRKIAQKAIIHWTGNSGLAGKFLNELYNPAEYHGLFKGDLPFKLGTKESVLFYAFMKKQMNKKRPKNQIKDASIELYLLKLTCGGY